MRVLLTLQYLGTRYAGWQSQANATAIQDVVEEALARMYGTRLRIEAAGRTDSGVHAAAQRAHVDAPVTIAPRGVMLGLNDLLPHDIRVIAVEEVDPGFHCRFAAKEKTYRYAIWNAPVMDVFRWETHAHVTARLDVEAMAAAAAALEGTHDFRAFTVLEPEVSSTVRTVTAVSVTASRARYQGRGSRVEDQGRGSRVEGREKREERELSDSSFFPRPSSLDSVSLDPRPSTLDPVSLDPRPSTLDPVSLDPRPSTLDPVEVSIRISADGFLRYMVRRIAGSLIEIGRGKLDAAAIARSLEPQFAQARWTAPAKGLVLEEIRY